MDAIGDVAVLDGQIAAVGTGLGSRAGDRRDWPRGVAPGFIDLHAHRPRSPGGVAGNR